MQISQAVHCWLEYHRSHSKKNTIRSYEFIGERLCQHFDGREIDTITTDAVLTFLNSVNESTKPHTSKADTPISHPSSTSSETTLIKNFSIPVIHLCRERYSGLVRKLNGKLSKKSLSMRSSFALPNPEIDCFWSL